MSSLSFRAGRLTMTGPEERTFLDTLAARSSAILGWRWFGLINSLVVLGLLVWLISTRFELRETLLLWRSAHTGWLLLAWAFGMLMMLSAAARTADIVSLEAGKPVSWAAVLRLQFVTLFMSFTVPIAFAVDVARIALLTQRFDISVGSATRCVLYDRLVGALGMIGVGLLSFILQPFFFRLDGRTASFQIAIQLAALLMVAAIVLFGRRSLEFPGKLGEYVNISINRLADNFRSPGFLIKQSLYALAYCALGAAIFWSVTRAMNLNVPVVALVAFVPLILFVNSLPFLYAGWGGREVVVVALLSGLAGAPSNHALVLSVTYGFVMLCLALPGAALWMARPDFRKPSGDPTAAQPPSA
jgi:uncharacterized membrane protein YbhN (UPF0104 family)